MTPVIMIRRTTALMMPIMLTVLTVLAGCGKNNTGGQNTTGYYSNYHVENLNIEELRARVRKKDFRSGARANKNYIQFTYNKSVHTVPILKTTSKKCKIVFFKANCVKTSSGGKQKRSNSLHVRYRNYRQQDGRRITLAKYQGGRWDTQDVQQYREERMNYLLYTVLANNRASAEKIKMSMLTRYSYHRDTVQIVNNIRNISRAFLGNDNGDIIKVELEGSVYFFSFDLPLEINPIWEISSRDVSKSETLDDESEVNVIREEEYIYPNSQIIR